MREQLQHAAHTCDARVRHGRHQLDVIVVPFLGPGAVFDLEVVHNGVDGFFSLCAEEMKRFDVAFEKILDDCRMALDIGAHPRNRRSRIFDVELAQIRQLAHAHLLRDAVEGRGQHGCRDHAARERVQASLLTFRDGNEDHVLIGHQAPPPQGEA